jgi:hypothetical protein
VACRRLASGDALALSFAYPVNPAGIHKAPKRDYDPLAQR